MSQEIVLKLKAFDHRVLDHSVRDIVSTVKRSGAKIRGPIPMPRKIKKFTVHRSTHIFIKSREQFEMRCHTRLMFIEPSPQTVDSLMKLDLPSGVEVEIKLNEAA
jgi:small subunit ribosomal protein S10